LEAGKELEIDQEFYRYELNLVQGQLKSIEEEIEKLQNQYPQLRALNMQQLREKLLDIEADTYAELIRAGRLNNRLSPVMQEILTESTEDERD
jgi:CPA1 family monovalent cation:H+ antiporter